MCSVLTLQVFCAILSGKKMVSQRVHRLTWVCVCVCVLHRQPENIFNKTEFQCVQLAKMRADKITYFYCMSACFGCKWHLFCSLLLLLLFLSVGWLLYGRCLCIYVCVCVYLSIPSRIISIFTFVAIDCVLILPVPLTAIMFSISSVSCCCFCFIIFSLFCGGRQPL